MYVLFYYIQFFTHLDKCFDSFIKMFCFVASGQLYADTGLVFRHYRIIETGYINAFFLHLSCEILR